jgi:hypothetical protein
MIRDAFLESVQYFGLFCGKGKQVRGDKGLARHKDKLRISQCRRILRLALPYSRLRHCRYWSRYAESESPLR